MREARGDFERGSGLTATPKVRVGVGFGRDRIAGTSALVDTGSDLCVFPASLFPWRIPERGEPDVELEIADGSVFPATLSYPSVTVGDIRETEVASVILPNAPPILGRSFLNRCALRVTARHDLVHLRGVSAPTGNGPNGREPRDRG